MGATVFNQAKALSFITASGEVAYVWTENTHCIKDGPKAASWCAMKFGRKKEMIERIYLLAESIPGGMLKVNGRSPVKFVSDMLAVIEQPSLLALDRVVLDNVKQGFSAAITDDNRSEAIQALEAMGRSDLAQRLSVPKEDGGEGYITLDPVKDFDVLNMMFNHMRFKDGSWGEARGINVWKVFHSTLGRCNTAEGPSEPTYGSTLKGKPRIELYKTRIHIGYAGSSEKAFAHVLLVDGRVVFVGRDDYEMDVAIIRLSAKKHAEEDIFFIKAAFDALKAARQSVRDLPDDVQFRLQSPLENRWLREQFEAVSTSLTGQARHDLTVSHDLLANISYERSSELRYLMDGHAVETQRIQVLMLDEQPALI